MLGIILKDPGPLNSGNEVKKGPAFQVIFGNFQYVPNFHFGLFILIAHEELKETI